MITALFALLLAAPSFAFNRGYVELENRSRVPGETRPYYELWEHVGWHYAFFAGGWRLTDKVVPYTGSGHFLIPAPNQIVFHSEQTVSFWDGVVHNFWEEGKGYVDIFHDDTELGEIAPMRSGNFLVPERSNDRARGAKVIEFNLQGRVAEVRFPEVVDVASGRAVGASHIELLADQCTLLYGVGNRVARLDICTGAARSDFAVLHADESAGSIRQMPNGEVLVASGSAVLQFAANGTLLRSYSFPGVTNVALTPEGTAFWAAGVDADKAELRRFDPNVVGGNPTTIPLGNPEMTSAAVPVDVSDLVVVGEWRPALQPGRVRVRAVR
jgi:hypothetical protein